MRAERERLQCCTMMSVFVRSVGLWHKNCKILSTQISCVLYGEGKAESRQLTISQAWGVEHININLKMFHIMNGNILQIYSNFSKNFPTHRREREHTQTLFSWTITRRTRSFLMSIGKISSEIVNVKIIRSHSTSPPLVENWKGKLSLGKREFSRRGVEEKIRFSRELEHNQCLFDESTQRRENCWSSCGFSLEKQQRVQRVKTENRISTTSAQRE